MSTALSRIGRSAIRSLQALIPATEPGLVILGYHLVEGGAASPVDLPELTFARQMDEIRRLGEPLPLGTALGQLRSAPPAQDERPLVVVTFDDAYENFRRTAWPILRDKSIPVTLYVPTGFVDGRIDSPIRGAHDDAPLSWNRLETMAAHPLLTIGSHGVSHANLALATPEQARYELTASRERLEDRLGVTVDSFCYPEGGCTPRVEALAAEVYRSAVIAGGRRVTPGYRRMTALPRIPIRRDMPESLEPVLRSRIWLEEWIAARVRTLRWRRRRAGIAAEASGDRP